MFLRFTIARPRTALADPDTEAVKDVWNLRVFSALGAPHFRTDPSYQPDLRNYLLALLKDKERLASAVPGLEEWARNDALPSDEEIEAVRRLMQRNDALVAGLAPEERATAEEALRVMRTSRAQVQTAVPVQLLGTNRQPAPTVFP